MPIFSAGSASVQIVPDFSGAQKAIGEFFARQSDIKVKVTPDLANGDVARTEAELNAMHGTAKVNVDRNFLTSSITGALAEAFGRSGLDKLGSLLSASLKPTLVTAAAGAFTELAAAASQAVGVLALAPALIGAIAAPAAVVAVGVQGMGAAFKALDTGNAQKIAQTMANLAPAARDFVTQVHALAPALHDLRLDVQQSLFQGVGTAVTNLATVALPVLHTGLTAIATGLNEGLLATMTALQGQGANFATLFGNIGASLHVAAGAAAPLVAAFGTLAAVGSQFLPGLAQGFVNVATAFNNWIQHIAESGQLVTIIQNAIDVLKQLATLAGNVIGIVSGIFTAALPYGRIMLQLLIDLTGSLSAFIHSADGQAALGSFFSSITVAMGTLLPALGVLVQSIVTAVLPAIGQFAALLAPIGATLLVQLASVLNQVAGILPPVAVVFAALVSAMAPLIPIVGQIVTTLLPPLITFLGQLAPIISQVSQTLGGALLAAAQALAPVLPVLGNAFIIIAQAISGLLLQAVQAITPLLPVLAAAFEHIVAALTPMIPPLVQVAQQLIPPLVAVIGALIPLVTGLVTVFAPLVTTLLKIADATVLPFVVGLINSFAAGIKVLAGLLGPFAPVLQAIAVAVGVWTAAQWLLNIAMDANPIGLIITAIGLLIVAIGFIATHLHDIAAIWTSVWGAIKDFFISVWNDISNFFHTVWDAIVTWFTTTLNNFVAFWVGIWNSVSNFFVTIWNAITNFFHTIWDAIVSWFTTQINNFVTGWQNFWNLVFSFFQSIWTTLTTWIVNTWNSIASFFTNAWNAFTTAWSNFWNSVFSFFQSIWTSLMTWAENTWNSIASFFTNAWNAFTTAWSNFWNSVLSFFQGIWNNLVSWVQGVWNNLAGWFTGVWNTFIAAWTNVWNTVFGAFQTVWNSIKDFAQTVWDEIKTIIEAPIKFVVNTIIRDGLIWAWNKVVDFLHLTALHVDFPGITSFATGGYTGDTGVFGTGGREDPAGVVHAREFVFTANQVDNAGGPQVMYGLASQLDSGFAMGGLVRQQASDPQAYLNSYLVPPTVAPRVQHFLDALSTGQAEAVQAAGGFDALGPGFFYGGAVNGLAAAQLVATRMNGQPYVWGGVGPGGADCSGFQSALTNALRGSNAPFARVGTTANFPWPGFTPGLTTSYAIGSVKDAGGGVGHMAGTLAGVNVESGGAHNNVAYGGPAAGANASLFNIHASLPDAGGVYAPGIAGLSGSASAPIQVSILGKIINTVDDILNAIADAIAGPIKDLVAKFDGASKLTQTLVEFPKQLLTGMWDAGKDAIGAALAVATSPASNNPTTAPGLLDQAAAIANDMYGWNTAADRAAIDYIVSHESGWNPTAQNPTSTASGLWQEIDSTWLANRPIGDTAAHMKDATTGDQDHAGIKYVHDRYGTLPAAQAFWAAHHYYDTGGWLPPGATSVYNGTGQFEAVLNAAQQAALTHVLTARPDGGGDTLVEVYIGNEKLDGHIDQRISHQQGRDARTMRSYQ